ncbi:MAG TPA: hypothetical protein PKO28_01425 [Bacilli bacterium]|nr:hypothetical protein [Bacilli bacterium]
MKKLRFALISLTLVLTSCFGATSLEFVPYLADLDELDTFNSEVSTYVLPKEAYFYDKTVKATEISSLAQMESSRDNGLFFEQGKDPYLLVVPMTFKEDVDPDADVLAKKRTLIQNAFFGDAAKNAYQSVASYYNQSSYGHLKILGEVTEWYHSQMTAAEALHNSKFGSTALTVSSDIANEIVTWLFNSDFDLTNYLTEGNQYIRGLYIVYDYPPNYQDTSSLFWAYVDRASKNKVASTPSAATYAWSSIDFMGEKAYKNNIVEAYTFIHEVGHLFGLRDYYNTVGGSGYQPTGFFDMMDYNLGDHCSFSKYLLHWATPIIIDKPQQITINSFTQAGDFLLIPTSKFNGTPYDEYILIEYFTPDGLNDSSSFSSYVYADQEGKSRVFYYPNYHGLRIYHIDARLSCYDGRTKLGYAENMTAEQLAPYSNLYVGFAHDNSPLSLAEPTLCHLLSAKGEGNYQSGIAADNSTLFAYRDTFGTADDDYGDFTFNKNGESLPYSMVIDHMGVNNITLTFSAK